MTIKVMKEDDMRPVNKSLRTILLSATLAMAMPGIAYAGKASDAQAAIAEARGKISAGNIAGSATESNSLQLQAKAELNQAEMLLSKGKKDEAIAAAKQAGLLADQALAMASGSKAAAADNAVNDAQAAAATAQQSAAASAQDAAAANARADMAMTAPQSTTTTIATSAPVAAAATTTKRKTTTRVVQKPPAATQSTTVTTTTPN